MRGIKNNELLECYRNFSDILKLKKSFHLETLAQYLKFNTFIQQNNYKHKMRIMYQKTLPVIVYKTEKNRN